MEKKNTQISEIKETLDKVLALLVESKMEANFRKPNNNDWKKDSDKTISVYLASEKDPK